jgi:hypothetical protein
MQVAMRVYEYQCIARALRANDVSGIRDRSQARLEAAKGNVDDLQPKLTGTQYRVYCTGPLGGPAIADRNGLAIFKPSKAFRKKTAKGPFVVSPVIENFLRFQQNTLSPFRNGDESYWDIYTELSAAFPDENNKRMTIRCHPNYQNEGPWNDWVMARFDTVGTTFEHSAHTTQFDMSLVPCKVLAIAQDGEGRIMLLVHGCHFRETKQDRDEDSVLIEFWHLEYHNISDRLPPKMRDRGVQYYAPNLTWVGIENIHCRCLVVEEEPGIHEEAPREANGSLKNRVMLVRRYSLWKNEFTSE